MNSSSEYKFTMQEVCALQKRIKAGESISIALSSVVAFDEIKEPTLDYLLAVWLPFAERMKDGEDVVASLVTSPEYPYPYIRGFFK